jgi:flagella basal body P-ring formation protein FlgA
MARAAGAELAQTNWAGADSVRISRRVRNLTETEILALLTAELQKNYVKDRGELELRLPRPWTVVSVPDEPLTVKLLDMPALGVTPTFVARFQLSTPHEDLGVFQAVVEASMWRQVWVASAALKHGDFLENSTIASERRNVINLREPIAEVTPGDSSIMVGEPVPPGSILLARQLKPRPVVHRGETADGIFKDGALSISLRVEILEDGVPGQIVRVRNPESRRDVHGKVINEQTVLIVL